MVSFEPIRNNNNHITSPSNDFPTPDISDQVKKDSSLTKDYFDLPLPIRIILERDPLKVLDLSFTKFINEDRKNESPELVSHIYSIFEKAREQILGFEISPELDQKEINRYVHSFLLSANNNFDTICDKLNKKLKRLNELMNKVIKELEQVGSPGPRLLSYFKDSVKLVESALKLAHQHEELAIIKESIECLE